MITPARDVGPSRSPSITPLPPRTTTPLRSSLIIPTLSQLLSELVQNSLDAGASRVECIVNLSMGVEGVRVEDDGQGITREGLKRIGRRYATSKSLNTPGMGLAGSYGYRGEALSSVASLGMMEITSKTVASPNTYTKLIKDSKVLYEGISSRTILGSHGTIVSVKDLFHNVPVRQTALAATSPQTTLSSCKRVIETLALARPGVSWVCWDESQDGQGMKRVLHIPQVNTSIEAFRHIYGNASVERVQSIRVSSGKRRIEGFISMEGLVSKSHQHLYVNHYPLEKGELHQAIAKRFASSRFSSMTSDGAMESDAPHHQRRSPRRLGRYPIYVLDVSLPYDEVDVGYEPKKGVLGHKSFDAVKAFVLAVVDQFLKRHGFANTPRPQAAPISPSKSPRKRMVLGEHISPPRTDVTTPIFTSLVQYILSKRARSDITANNRIDSFLATPIVARLLHSEPPRKRARLTPKPGERTVLPAGAWLQDLLTEMESGGALPISLRNSPRSTNGFSAPNGHLERVLPPHALRKFPRPADCCSHTPQALPHHIPQPITSEITFPKNALRSVTVLKQVDRKFIPCILQSDRGKTLALLDQHAADERVSVEGILKGLCEGFWRDDLEVTTLTNTKPRMVLSREEGQIFSRPGLAEVFRRWGVHLEMGSRQGQGDDYCQVEVKAVPTVLISRLGRQEASEMTRLMKLYLPILERLMGELSVVLGNLGGENMDWRKMMRWMPKEILELANSRACRGAIMFGDELNLDQCERLVARLAKTESPFICAHGRPSLVPLVVLRKKMGEETDSCLQMPRRQINWSLWKGLQ